MPMLNITLPHAMKAFIDSKVGPGRLPDASAYVQVLIAQEMESQRIDFAWEEKERIEQLLLDAVDQVERGECAPLAAR